MNYKNIIWLGVGIVLGLAFSRLNFLGKLTFYKAAPIPTQTGAQKFEEEMKKYTVNIPTNYFDGTIDNFYGTDNKIIKGFLIDNLPQAIPMDNSIQAISEKFDPKTICGKNIICNIKYESTFDVDGDNKKEQLVSIFRGVNHGVDDKYILKNGQIIFKILNNPTTITESESHNGFYLTYYLDTFLATPGKRTVVRYVHDQGRFIPVWTQTSTELQISKS